LAGEIQTLSNFVKQIFNLQLSLKIIHLVLPDNGKHASKMHRWTSRMGSGDRMDPLSTHIHPMIKSFQPPPFFPDGKWNGTMAWEVLADRNNIGQLCQGFS